MQAIIIGSIYSLFAAYHEIRQGIDEFGDLLQSWGFMDQFVAMAIQNDFLQVFQISTVDQGSQVGSVWWWNCKGESVLTFWQK